MVVGIGIEGREVEVVRQSQILARGRDVSFEEIAQLLRLYKVN